MSATLEPTPGQIQMEMAKGHSWEAARRIVQTRLEAELNKVFSTCPEAKSELDAAAIEAAEAQGRATQALKDKQVAITGLEGAIDRLGRLRDHSAAIEAFKATPEQTAHAGEMLLDAFLLNRQQGTEQTKGALAGSMQSLLESVCVQRFIEPYVARLRGEAETLVAEIKATAKKEKVNLPQLLRAMVSTAKDTSFVRIKNLHLHDLETND